VNQIVITKNCVRKEFGLIKRLFR